MRGLVAPTRLPPPAAGVLLAATLGFAGASSLELLPGRGGMLSAAALLCLVVFILWPWAVLPVGIVGGVVVTKLLGDTDVTFITTVHVGILTVGCLALLTRRAAASTHDEPQRTRADAAMALLAVIVLAGALFGLARGHSLHRVMIATYHIGVIPAYYFLATHTLTTAPRLKAAAVLYAAGSGVLAAVELTMPGRHGGLLSVLALLPLLITLHHTDGWRRSGLMVLIALFATDTAVAGYRAMLLAVGVALLVLLVRGTPHIRRNVLMGVLASAVLFIGAAAISAGLRDRISLAGGRMEDTLGYRLPEALVGLRVFADWPLTGAGIGQTTPHIFLPTFKITDVGPIYHLFWVMILANLGLVGLIAVLWPLGQAVRASLAARDGAALAFGSLICGFLAAAAFAGPTDGHWELGLLPALTLLTTRHQTDRAGPPNTGGSM